MNRSGTVVLAVLMCVMAACAATRTGKAAGGSSASTQQEIADQARSSRNDAYVLAEMAARREREAEVLARELGQDHPRVQEKRRLAQELRGSADEADREARELRQAVPHGMVQ